MKVFGIAGYSGSGKTTLLEKLLPRLTARGLRVSVIKHAHHTFDMDQPGKDSYRHRAAGASEVLLASATRWVLLNELRGAPEPTLEEYLTRFSPCDLVLVEGFKQEAIPKLEIHRPVTGKPPLWPDNPYIVAVATDVSPEVLPLPEHLHRLDVNDPEAIACFILETLALPLSLPLSLPLHLSPSSPDLQEGEPHAVI